MGASHLSGPLVLTGSAGVVYGTVKPLIPSTGLAAVAGNIFGSADTGLYVNWLRIPLSAGTGSEQDTGIDLPARGLVLPGIFLYVRTAEATGTTKTVDVGLLSSESGGDLDGFIDGISVASTGLKLPSFVPTVGSNNLSYLGAAATHTWGVLFTKLLIEGSDVAVSSSSGFAITGPHVLNGTAKSVVWKAGSAQTEFVGTLFIPYIEVAT